MTENLAIIPARGGSKGIPRKNVLPLAGKPLIAHTIEQARCAAHVGRVVVSTDDSEIAVVSEQYGAEVVWRPAELSGDEATSESALLHTLATLKQKDGYEPNLVVFLQCTAPIRRLEDIDEAIRTLQARNADSLVSVVRVYSWLWRIVDGKPTSFNYDYQSRKRRQERPTEYNENGSFYIFKPWVLRQLGNRLGGKIALYEMNPWSNIDIESLEDLELAEWVMTRHALISERERNVCDG